MGYLCIQLNPIQLLTELTKKNNPIQLLTECATIIVIQPSTSIGGCPNPIASYALSLFNLHLSYACSLVTVFPY